MILIVLGRRLAEWVGFEPTEAFTSTDFESVPL